MKSRAGDTVFWPGIVGDISTTRWECMDCHRMAKSHPQALPHPLADPEYPFQQLAADYFHYGGKSYLVIVDIYSHWPMVYRAQDGSRGLVMLLRRVFSTFGVDNFHMAILSYKNTIDPVTKFSPALAVF